MYANKWRSLPPIPNMRHGAALAVSDGKIFFIGGSPWIELPDGSPYYRVLDAVEIFCIKEEVILRSGIVKIFFSKTHSRGESQSNYILSF